MVPKDHDSDRKKTQLVINYLTLRKSIGILGVSLPLVLVLGSAVGNNPQVKVLDSISSYYYTNMGDVFVGILCAVGLFLFSYRGYDYADNLLGNLSGLFAFGIALFPTPPPTTFPVANPLVGKIHFASAALFFVVSAAFSLFLFTKTDQQKLSARAAKVKRNIIYRICGITMVGALALILIYHCLGGAAQTKLEPLHPVFWLESLALTAFGISWLTKGNVLLKDVGEEK